MLDKRAWVARHCDWLRTALMHEPRGHADMYGAVLTEPCSEAAHAGVLFMHNEGYSTMCGHGVVAVCTIALERGLISVPGAPPAIVLESPAGLVRARAVRAEPTPEDPAPSRVAAVAFENVPSFVYRAGLPVPANNRTVAVDVAFGGAFYASWTARRWGFPLRPDSLAALRATAWTSRGRSSACCA